MKKCSPAGRDCIERNTIVSFNCSVSCEGIYADVQWVNDPIQEGREPEEETEIFHWENEDVESVFVEGGVNIQLLKAMLKSLDKKTMLLKKSDDNRSKRGEDLDKENFKKLISEYRKFKMKNVKHFQFDENAISSVFGRFDINIFKHIMVIQF